MDKLDLIKNRDGDLSDFDIVIPYNEDGYPDYGYYDRGETADSKHVVQLFVSALLRHWVLISAIILTLTGAAVFLVAQQPDYFMTSSRVQVNSEISPQLKSAAVIVNSGTDPEYLSTQLEVLQSSALMRRVVKSLDLENNEDFLYPQKYKDRGPILNVFRMFGLAGDPGPARKPEAPVVAVKKTLSLDTKLSRDPNEESTRMAPYVGMLKRGLFISPVKDTRLIEITFTHENPQIAAKVANTIADAFVLQNLEQKVQTNLSAGDFLQKRVAELQSEIRRDEERLINYARQNQIISLDTEQNTVVQKLSTLNGELGTAENERLQALTAYQAARQNELWKTNITSNNPQVTALESKLSELRQKLGQLKTQYTDDWFEVVQVKKEIADVEQQIQNLSKRATGTKMAELEQNLNQATAKVNVLRDSFNTQRSAVIDQNEAAINYRIIQQEIETNKSLLDGLLQRSKENEVVVAGTDNNILVLDRATAPGSPYGPNRFQSVLLALILASAFGIGVAFAADWLNDSIGLADNPEALLGLPMLAGIPLAGSGITEKLLPKRFLLRRRNRAVDRYYSPAIFDAPVFQEAYLHLVTHILFSSAGGPPKTILVTSAEAGEGKTVTAMNIATSLAKTKKKTLLLDCDLRCPRIQSIKQVTLKGGLTNLVVGETLTDEVIEEAIYTDLETGVDMMFAGDKTPNAAGLLSSEEMKILVEKLSESYSHIVIDSPPVLHFADALILSSIGDAVVIVARDGYSSKHAVSKAAKLLTQVGAKIAGFVMNGVPARTPYYYGYYGSEGALGTGDNGNGNSPQTLGLE